MFVTTNWSFSTTASLFTQHDINVDGSVNANTICLGGTSGPYCRTTWPMLTGYPRPASPYGQGTLWFTPGGNGVKDELAVYAKDAAGNYAWRVLY